MTSKTTNYLLILFFFSIILCSCNTSDDRLAAVTPTPDSINYPQEADSVIIKAQVTLTDLSIGEIVLSPITEFCLYGDRRVIYRAEPVNPADKFLPVQLMNKAMEKIYSPPSLEEDLHYPLISSKMMTGKLKEIEVQELLKFILEEKKILDFEKEEEGQEKKLLFSLHINTARGYRTSTFSLDSPKELLEIYSKLKSFDLDRGETYRPSKISLSVYRVPDYMDNCTRKATLWNFEEIDLKALSNEYEPGDIGGEGINRLLDFFERFPPDDFFYFQGNMVYGIFYKPYLPEEILD